MDWLRWHFVEHRALIIATVIIVAVFLTLKRDGITIAL
jgi:hypothetical protein